MKIEGQGKLLRIFIGEQDKYRGKPLFEAIIERLRELGIAGCTILRGIEGYGAASRVIHTAKILRLSEDLPIIIEIVDIEERIKTALNILDEMIDEANSGVLITLERVEVLRYQPQAHIKQPPK